MTPDQRPVSFPGPGAMSTEFLSATRAAQLVGRTGVVECLRGMAQAIEEDYARWQDFDKSARTASHSPNGVIELMPVADARDYAFKYVNGHPVNTRRGLPTVMAFGALADVATGHPSFLSELTLTTALRTAATSAMVARHLARPDSRSMALIGNGAQSEFQALAFVGLLGIGELRLYDIDPAATAKLAANLAPLVARGELEMVRCASTAEAVRGADIVTTVTADKAYATILHGDLVEPGMHINAVGGDCPGKTELAAEVLRAASVFVEYEPQTRIEGDLQQMPADFPVTEFWRVVRGEAPARTSPAQVTVFDSVGFALEDYSALRFMRALGRSAGLLQRLELIPEQADPKDLYAQLQPWLALGTPASAPPLVQAAAHLAQAL
ncbi:ornithine cyclodeaminase [Acidovorax sp. NCPPB 3576]|uniref:ornithine cyclodeaminase n=1 Tax=Acidovorax sp. NCPPB 3576 TaxID=2940488 RepID=UPI00234AC552|nr:ornithine cyclodeaminase [Acidovorax sp. NCPPB 3576]